MDKVQLEIERRKWCDRIPELYRNVFRRAMKGNSLRAAINAKCQDCCTWQRAEIKDCLVPCCPLYPYRPYQPKKDKTPHGLAEKAPNPLSVGTLENERP